MLTTGYKSKYRNRTRWQKFADWCKQPANRFEECMGVVFIALGAAIGLELAIVSIFNAIYWGL